MNKKKPYQYDVALSFASEERRYVHQVAKCLEEKGIKVFFDEYNQVKLWGKDMYTYLDEVYQFHSRYCVMFLSKHYAEKKWTNHERKSAQARAFQENEEYILPYRFDQTTIPGIRPTISYLEHLTPIELSNAIIAKLNNKEPTQSTSSSFSKTLEKYKDWLRNFSSEQGMIEVLKELKITPKDPLSNFIYCLFFLKQKELTTFNSRVSQIEAVEKRLSLSLKEAQLKSTVLTIQAFIKHDFHESRGWDTIPSSKAIFQTLINNKTAPDKELLQYLKLSGQFTYKLNQILAWLK